MQASDARAGFGTRMSCVLNVERVLLVGLCGRRARGGAAVAMLGDTRLDFHETEGGLVGIQNDEERGSENGRARQEYAQGTGVRVELTFGMRPRNCVMENGYREQGN